MQPAFLLPDYPYNADGNSITDAELMEPGSIYEIKCTQCEMSIRSQGKNAASLYKKLRNTGCIGCGNRELKINQINQKNDYYS